MADEWTPDPITLRWVADRIEHSARDVIVDLQLRYGDSKREKSLRAKRGHGSSALISLAHQIRRWANDGAIDSGQSGLGLPTDLPPSLAERGRST